MRKQNTIKSNVEFKGVGLHSGHLSHVIIKPAPEDTGIVFVKKSGQTNQFIPYSVDNVIDTQSNISISNGISTIKTVEHLAASLYALHVDNCLIECSSSEIPIMDGSTIDFANLITGAGIIPQEKYREEFRVFQPVWVTLEDKFLVALPYNGLKMSYTISFPGSPIGTQTYQTEINPEIFLNKLSAARTFGFIEDLESNQKNGLSLGVNFDNVHAFSKKENKALNSQRFEDEPVRHKTVDLLGGLALLNLEMKGFIISYKGGHTLDVLFAKKVIQLINGIGTSQSSFRYHPDSNYYYSMADILELDKTPS